eukprot:gnl/TRDRNA2_/TRDRNA2_37627_c0_seq1.p1 gnl/TRDRNA2_/TRDRNA2_37627_c0~~gnl/TRDRNA2_/TRDRNA2_37627_c0_seq1.p1  ORF type:complete len:365 (+),score=121.20 gnl/TRDRNA2_/TRDRNA2_37627_c0_seq1:101-1096(+)
MAGAHLEKDEVEDALTALNEAQNIFGDMRDDAGVAMAAIYMARGYLKRGDAEEAQSNANDAYKRFQKAKHQKGEAFGLITLAAVGEAKGDTNAQLKRGQAALDILESAGDPEMMIMALQHVMMGNLGENDTFEAAGNAEHAATIAAGLGDTKKQANYTLMVAKIELQGADYEKAVEAVKSALSLYHQSGDVVGQAETLGVFVEINKAQGNVPQVLKTSKDICELLEKHQLWAQRAYAGIRLADCYMEYQMAEEATTHAEKAMAIFFELKDKDGMELTKEVIKKGNHESLKKRIENCLDSYGEFCTFPGTLRIDPGLTENIREEYSKGIAGK